MVWAISEVGGRYAEVGIGSPAQQIEVDLDMLTADFYVLTTTSGRGAKLHDYFSGSYRMLCAVGSDFGSWS